MLINRKEKLIIGSSVCIIGLGILLYVSKEKIMEKLSNSPSLVMTYKESQSKKLKKEIEKKINDKNFNSIMNRLSMEKLEILKESLEFPEVVDALNTKDNSKYNSDRYFSPDVTQEEAVKIANISKGFGEIEVLSVEFKNYLSEKYPNFNYNEINKNENKIPDVLKIKDKVLKLFPDKEIADIIKTLNGEQLNKINNIIAGNAEVVSLMEFKEEDIDNFKKYEEDFFNSRLILDDMKKVVATSKGIDEITLVSPKLKEIVDQHLKNIDYKKMSSFGEFYLLDKNSDIELEKQYREKYYTFETPFIKLNPYGRTPLSAIVKIENEAVGKDITITIEGKENSPDYTYKTKVKANGEIPIIGLYPKAVNKVSLKMNNNGMLKTKNIVIETSLIDDSLPAVVIEKKVDGSIEHGMNLVSFNTKDESLPFIFDSNANIRYLLIVSPVIKKSLLDRNERGNWEAVDDNLIFEFDILGKIVNIQDNNRIKLDENWKNGVLFRNNQYLPKKNNILIVYGFSDKAYPSGVFSEIGKDSGNELFKARLYYDKNSFEDNSILSGKRIELFQE
ncbi:aryl-sulfate sulfotransferase [Fusobacterium ulcerans]|uniref:aryl-sulfate sulfotransferase n=1 Tax=Fusobacterium ulcerans TaxID=861 RepID=UPI003FED6E10